MTNQKQMPDGHGYLNPSGANYKGLQVAFKGKIVIAGVAYKLRAWQGASSSGGVYLSLEAKAAIR